MIRSSMNNETRIPGVRLIKIVSGGQTGADRAALDVAIERAVPVGGWCPRGRLAENGRIPLQYTLQETPSDRYAERTSWNVRDSDATLVFTMADIGGGTAFTIEEARRLGKPIKLVDPRAFNPVDIQVWLTAHSIRILNVAGPRESEQPGIYNATRTAINRIIEIVEEASPSEARSDADPHTAG